jgi:hypothetical protein
VETAEARVAEVRRRLDAYPAEPNDDEGVQVFTHPGGNVTLQ